MTPTKLSKFTTFFHFFFNNYLYPLLAWSFFRIQGLGRIQSGAVLLYREYLNLGRKRSSREKKPLKKTKPKVKWHTMNVNLILTKYYEDQQKPGKKTKPICWSNSLFLSEKSMIPNYIKICKTKPIGK